jgi:DNA-binding GntR family transcriptional regulator
MDRHLLHRSSTAERVASILRSRIAEGLLPPGTRLSEEAIGEALGVSRNTLREAFRLLTHERLLVHELNRGVFVRTLTEADVVALFRVRRVIECAAVRELASVAPETLAKVRRAVEEGEDAARDDRWPDVSTANIHFHQAIVELAGSSRLDEFMNQILAELRLIFHVMKDPRRFHEPYLARNRGLLVTIEAGEPAAAESLLSMYLADAESQLVGAYARAME